MEMSSDAAIPLSNMVLSNRERENVLDAISSTELSATGPYVQHFESLISQRVGVQHAVATCSGTAALELVLRGMSIGSGDEVVLPALTFASPALAVALAGATPVFVDVSPNTWTIDPLAAEAAISSRTRALITVDVMGHPCDYDSLTALGVPVIEDAAEAHGATYKGRPVGSFGNVAVMSFHANKAVSSGEGGCILTDDGALAERLRSLNAFGTLPDRKYWHSLVGSNYRMSNLVAAVASAQVERWDELLSARARVARRYDSALSSLPVERRPVESWAVESVWLYTIASARRAEILRVCQDRHIDARAVWPALPHNPVFGSAFGRWPCAESVASRAMWLPTWAELPDAAIQSVVGAIASALDRMT